MKRILVVGMFDSIHFARWLRQFEDQNLHISIFPSARFRKLHPDLESLLQDNQVKLYLKLPKKIFTLLGYVDFLKFEFLPIKVKTSLRGRALKRFLEKNVIDVLHLIELQHAGYLYLDSKSFKERKFKVISTNYGSDIIYFQSIPFHKEKLVSLLHNSDFYSAECRRDYQLARQLGFNGLDLPLMPNAGGFDDDIIKRSFTPLNSRRLVYVKGYGGKFGLGKTSLSVARTLLENYPDINVVVVSLTDDLRKVSAELSDLYRGRVTIYGIRDNVKREEILKLLGKSLICIGASQSDGISTTFLEALVSGAIPIQTDTSCANEWVDKGFFAKVVSTDESEIVNAAREVLSDPSSFELHAKKNIQLSAQHLSFETLRNKAIQFYNFETSENL
jgi:glycosyltransferase involved in cell wall biosynthesis